MTKLQWELERAHLQYAIPLLKRGTWACCEVCESRVRGEPMWMYQTEQWYLERGRVVALHAVCEECIATYDEFEAYVAKKLGMDKTEKKHVRKIAGSRLMEAGQ